MTLPAKPRWVYRFDNYGRAFFVLRKLVVSMNERELTDIEQMAIIQSFEITWELGWKLMSDYLQDGGLALERIMPITVIRAAEEAKLISDGEIWLRATKARNLTSHTYDKRIADKIIAEIRQEYFSVFENLYDLLISEVGHAHGTN